jgi:circadian clock protein KaiC
VRGSAHSNELRLFEIDDRGIRVGERVEGQEGLLGGRPTRKGPASQPGPEGPAGAESTATVRRP